MKNSIKKYVPISLFFAFILWLIVEADLDRQNVLIVIGEWVPWGDRIGHFTLFGVLALLLNMALRFKQVTVLRRTFHLGSLVVFAFALLEECSQLFISSRTFDLLDMLSDLVGIGVLSSVAFRRFMIRRLQKITAYLIEQLQVNL